jgi:hypothetical protein
VIFRSGKLRHFSGLRGTAWKIRCLDIACQFSAVSLPSRGFATAFRHLSDLRAEYVQDGDMVYGAGRCQPSDCTALTEQRPRYQRKLSRVCRVSMSLQLRQNPSGQQTIQAVRERRQLNSAPSWTLIFTRTPTHINHGPRLANIRRMGGEIREIGFCRVLQGSRLYWKPGFVVLGLQHRQLCCVLW